MTREELAAHDGVGSADGQIWIAVIGEVFDVTAGWKFYGPEGGYRGFAGCDGSRAFHTGDFAAGGLVESLEGLDDAAYVALDDWLRFYREEAAYAFVGTLAGGLYFDADGEPTSARADFDERARRGRLAAAAQRAREATFPACASRWSQESGGEVWCEDGRSFPRKEVSFDPSGGKRRVRCACFPDVSFSDTRELYPGCANTATRCKT